ncbi:MAG: hypothetical protein IJM79_03000 [Erysipelotrichaceae bacterium]|nr:hypothetical protein [Erysipelotrichaceae bacterium]
MNKTDIIAKMKDFPYEKEDYWIITGAALVLYGIREQTHDIDLGCNKKMADQLEEQGYLYKVMDNGCRWFKLSKELEVFENWLFDRVIQLEGLPVMSIKGIMEMKESLGREKDLRDLQLIMDYLKEKESVN